MAKVHHIEDNKSEFLNPLTPGVTYVDFLKEVGSKNVAEYCKGHLTEDEIKSLEVEINYLNKK